MARRPPAQPSDREQHDERDDEQEHRKGGGSLRVAGVQPLEDVERSNLRLEREVARDQDDRAELADRARERERDARQQRRKQVREDDASEDRQSPGAE